MNAHSSERSSPLTRRWRKPDSNHRFRVRKSGRCQVPAAIRPRSVEHLLWEEVLSLPWTAETTELSISPKDIRTSPYDLCANRSDRRQSREGDRRFESTSLQRGVNCEPVRAGGIGSGANSRHEQKRFPFAPWSDFPPPFPSRQGPPCAVCAQSGGPPSRFRHAPQRICLAPMHQPHP